MALTESPSEAELVQLGIESAMSRLFKAGPGIVRVYDPVTNTAFVQPAIKHAVYTAQDERTYEDLPEIPFVPVIFPRAGGFVLRTPVKQGDSVLLVYCDCSLAEWRQNGGTTEPVDARRHSIGWPVAIPGFFPDSSPMSAVDGAAAALQMIVGQDGGSQMRIGPTGIELGPAGTPPALHVALAEPTVAFLAALTVALTAVNTWAGALVAALNANSTPPAAGAAMSTPTATLATAVTTTLAAAQSLNSPLIRSTLVRSV